MGDGLRGYLRYKLGFSAGFTEQQKRCRQIRPSETSDAAAKQRYKEDDEDEDALVSMDAAVDGSSVLLPAANPPRFMRPESVRTHRHAHTKDDLKPS